MLRVLFHGKQLETRVLDCFVYSTLVEMDQLDDIVGKKVVWLWRYWYADTF